MSETRILRDREMATRASLLRLAKAAEDGSVAVLVRTKVVSSYPTIAGAFYACALLQVDGPETEGATATFTASGTRTIYALNLGTQIPPVGTKTIVHACGGRWTFRFDG
jgi:hypothetical protein